MANHDDPQCQDRLGNRWVGCNSIDCFDVLLPSIHHRLISGRIPQPHRNEHCHVDTHSHCNVNAYIYTHFYPNTNLHPHSDRQPNEYFNSQRDPNLL